MDINFITKSVTVTRGLPEQVERIQELEDEVERLRAALSFIAMARQPSMGQTWESHAIEMADYAAERLKEKE